MDDRWQWRRECFGVCGYKSFWGGGDYEDKVSMGDLWTRSFTHHHITAAKTLAQTHADILVYPDSHMQTHTCTFLPGIIPSIWHSNYSTHWFQWWMNSQARMSGLCLLLFSLSPWCSSFTTASIHVPYVALISSWCCSELCKMVELHPYSSFILAKLCFIKKINHKHF